MTLSIEQQDFQHAVRDFCARECATREQREALLDPDEEDQSLVLYKKLAELGWLGIAIPEEYGGSGGTYVEQTILFEELWRGLAPVKALGPTNTVAGCYKRFGSEEQKREALSAIANGEIMSISISEPGAGSDVAAITCRADAVADGYVLNGQKTWCSYAHRAGRILLVARTGRDGKPHAGLTIFEVPATAKVSKRVVSRPWAAAKSTTSSSPTVSFPPRTSSARSAGASRRSWPASTANACSAPRSASVSASAPLTTPSHMSRTQAVRQSHRNIPGTASSDRRPRDRARVRPSDHL